ncbi:helix-turn-helix domain-containing protein [Brevundimonas sp. G8]|uniref:helix-turn-helix domain-containing protein n=1 Tax=Brevundimonas sp. G8 TaxID=1350776 RepID=UPI001F2270BF|nr:helix-turn-helix transcriptional regulator [Brevundimonas sp. G8]
MPDLSSRIPHVVDRAVGARVVTRRLALGISQKVLAQDIGVSFQQVQKYESGKNRISSSRLSKIAAALDAPMIYFFEGLPTGADTHIDQPVVTPWANELITLESNLPASARKLILKMARQLATPDFTAG